MFGFGRKAPPSSFDDAIANAMAAIVELATKLSDPSQRLRPLTLADIDATEAFVVGQSINSIRQQMLREGGSADMIDMILPPIEKKMRKALGDELRARMPIDAMKVRGSA